MLKQTLQILSVLGIAGLLAGGMTSCSKDDLVGSHTDTSTGITIVANHLTFEPLGGSATLEVQANGVLSVELASEWCSATVSGNVVTVKAESNTSFEGRTALLTLHAGGATRQVPVQQRGMALGSLPVRSHHSPVAGERFSLYIRHDMPIHLTIDEDWLTARIEGDSLIVEVEPTTSRFVRRATIEY